MHTPGPWKWWTSNSFLRLTGKDGQDGGVLHATVGKSGVATVTVRPCDMPLIAAAPELLSELIEMRDAVASDYTGARGQDYTGGALARVDALIARAQGRTEL